jgi:hypothetical protein
MTHTKFIIATLGVAALLAAAPSPAAAQNRSRAVPRGNVSRGGGAVPRQYGRYDRGPVRVIRPEIVTVLPYRSYYRPGVSLGFYYGYPYRPYGYGYPGYGYPAYGYPAYGGYPQYGYGYPGGAVNVQAYGGVRIDMPQRDAEVYVDGYFAGMVDQYDGAFQQLSLTAGPHQIEVRAAGYETTAFDVNIEPGRTITYRASLRPAQP